MKALCWYDGAEWQRINEFQYTESDPVFNNHPSSTVSFPDIENWNHAYFRRLDSASAAGPLSFLLENNRLSGYILKAGSTQNGYLSSLDWNIFKNKQDALVFGHVTSSDLTITGSNSALRGNGHGLTIKKSNLTEMGSGVLTITNGSNSVLGLNGTTKQVKQAGSNQPGYLSSSDWNLFNIFGEN
jgi:hypothetical protein